MSESLATETAFDEENTVPVENPSDLEKEVQEKSPAKAVEMALLDSGLIEAGTDLELVKSVMRYMKMGLMPKQFKNPYEGAGAILYAKQLGLAPLTAWNDIALVHGKFSVFATLFRGLARRSPEYGEDEMFWLDKEQKRICADNKNLNSEVWAAVCRTKKKNGTIWNEYFFTMDDAKMAELVPPKRRDGSINYDSPWIKYPKDMLMYKSMARSYKANYSEALSGVQMYEDLVSNDEREVTPSANKIDLNSLAEDN